MARNRCSSGTQGYINACTMRRNIGPDKNDFPCRDICITWRMFDLSRKYMPAVRNFPTISGRYFRRRFEFQTINDITACAVALSILDTRRGDPDSPYESLLADRIIKYRCKTAGPVSVFMKPIKFLRLLYYRFVVTSCVTS